jgi:hypothetical protein
VRLYLRDEAVGKGRLLGGSRSLFGRSRGVFDIPIADEGIHAER